jgi:chromosome segregation ATPase
LERLKDELNGHFAEEIKAKKRIHELEQKMETAAMSILSKKNELAILMREKGKDNIQVKIINEEIDESNNQISEMKKHLDSTN